MFINVLGEEILGLSGLFTSFLSFLNLADLGLSSAFTYSLYKPIAEHNTERIRTLVNFYKKFYRILFLAVFGIGLVISPVVVASVRDVSISHSEAFAYYLLVLLNSACSYLAVYKTTLFRADQRVYIVNLSTTFATVICTALQIVLLLNTANYYYYLIVRIAITLIGNMIVSVIANRSYKEVFSFRGKTSLDTETKSYFVTSLKNLFVYKTSTTVINNSTNIIMSFVLGTAIVGLYSNYTLISNTISSFISLFNTSIIGSIGNLGVTSTPEKKKTVFFKLISVYFIISTFTSICLFLNLSDFVLLWLSRPDYILDIKSLSFYLLYFFLSNVCNPLWMTREANGLFTKIYPVIVARAIIFISISLALGFMIGMPGIFIGSIIALITTNMWYEPKMLCRDVFFCKYREFWIVFLIGLIKSTIVFILSILITSHMGSTILWMLVKCFTVGLLVLVIFSRDIIKLVR